MFRRIVSFLVLFATLTVCVDRVFAQNSWRNAELEFWHSRLSEPEYWKTTLTTGTGETSVVETEEILTPRFAAESSGNGRNVFFTNHRIPDIVAASIDESAKHALWATILMADDPNIPWSKVYECYRDVGERFPDSKYGIRAKESAATISEMLKAENDRKLQSTSGELDLRQQIGELIFQLMHQDGAQWAQPGGCDFFWNDRSSRGGKPSPAQQLVNIGTPAIPQLIEALHDERFTRSVQFHRDFYFSHKVLRVQDCVFGILVRITRQPFRRGNTTDAKIQLIKDWWREHQADSGTVPES